MKASRIALAVLGLAALAATGCFLTTGQYVVNYLLPTPFLVSGGSGSVNVDLNTISDYSDHKNDLKAVEDLAITGDFHNTGSTAVTVSVSIAPTFSGTSVPLWGPLSIAAGGTEHVDWNRSSGLFHGRQALIDEIKGDGKFRLDVTSSNALNVTLTNGAVITVISAGK